MNFEQMMDPGQMLQMMRKELTGIGFREMRTPQEVDSVLRKSIS